jgi:hypothetical protein
MECLRSQLTARESPRGQAQPEPEQAAANTPKPESSAASAPVTGGDTQLTAVGTSCTSADAPAVDTPAPADDAAAPALLHLLRCRRLLLRLNALVLLL